MKKWPSSRLRAKWLRHKGIISKRVYEEPDQFSAGQVLLHMNIYAFEYYMARIDEDYRK